MGTLSLTDLDRGLLELIQRHVPLTERPYAALAAELAGEGPASDPMAEQRLLGRLAVMRGGPEPIIREMCGLFEASSLGYASALVACRMDRAGLDAAGELAASHPATSHCYARTGKLNLWYTLTLGPDSRLGVEGTADLLARRMGAQISHVLPTLKRFKVGVHIDASGRMASEPGAGGSQPPPYRPLSDDEVRAVQALQVDLPNEPEPFAPLAAAAGLGQRRLLEIGNEFLSRGVLRRYAAVLHHRRAGLEANVLVAWRLGSSLGESVGRLAAASPAVSHCYLRPPKPGWPYTLYTMIHGRTREDCALVIDELAATTGLADHAAMWTEKEYKKSRTRYFDGAVAKWEERQAE